MPCIRASPCSNLCLFCHVVPTDKDSGRAALPLGPKKYCALFILISGRWVLWKPVHVDPVCSCGAGAGLLWCTDPVQHPSEQLASGGTGPSVLTAAAWSVTVHYAPIRWSEKSNTFLVSRAPLWGARPDKNVPRYSGRLASVIGCVIVDDVLVCMDRCVADRLALKPSDLINIIWQG